MSRKNRRKRAAATVDPQERRQRQLEERRAQRAAAEAAAARQHRRDRIVRLSLIALLVAGVFWFAFLRGDGKPAEINGHTVQALGEQGVGVHPPNPETIKYDTKPPVSGPHDSHPAPCGVYAEQVSDATQVHSLEHGAVGIQYDPSLDPDDVAAIEDIVRGYDENVFSGPYQGMETPIAVSAWGHLMGLETLDRTAITGFIDAFAGKGPEANQSCPITQDESFVPDATLSPSPGPTPKPSPSKSSKKSDKSKKSGTPTPTE